MKPGESSEIANQGSLLPKASRAGSQTHHGLSRGLFPSPPPSRHTSASSPSPHPQQQNQLLPRNDLPSPISASELPSSIRRMSLYPTPTASPIINFTELEELKDLSLGHQSPGIGLGSTTGGLGAGLDLRRHMRSHDKQKPYKCHWPGCDKGFAKQHDCKWHERLHSNNRPFVCDGCGRIFVWMDELDQHLREAGAECARAVEKMQEG